MRTILSEIEREDLKELFQNLSNQYGLVISVCWNNTFHQAFTPKKDEGLQLTLDGMEMPKITEFQESGE